MLRFVIAALIATTSVAQAIEAGNPRQGLRLAREICADCHAVSAAAEHPAASNAPRCDTLANTPGMNSAALSAALQTSHRTMPNLVVTGADAADIIAYILSLRRSTR